MDINVRKQHYQTLRQDFEAGRIDETSFAADVDKLGFKDGWGRYWSIGEQSGDWYWYDGQDWRRGDPNQAERLPFIDDEGRCWQYWPDDEAWYLFKPETGEWVASNQNQPAPVAPSIHPQVAVSKQVGLMVGILCAIILAWLVLLPVSSASPPTGPLPAPSPRPPLGGGGGGGGGGDGNSGGSTGPTGAIFGTVLDISTGQPAAGMEVEVSGQIVRTDSDGSYSITGLPAGEYVVSPVLNGQGTLVQGPVYAAVDGLNSITVDLNYTSESPPPRVEVTPLPPTITDQTVPPVLPSSGADTRYRPVMMIGLGFVLLLVGSGLHKRSERAGA